jgi:hypothetical protein
VASFLIQCTEIQIFLTHPFFVSVEKETMSEVGQPSARNCATSVVKSYTWYAQLCHKRIERTLNEHAMCVSDERSLTFHRLHFIHLHPPLTSLELTEKTQSWKRHGRNFFSDLESILLLDGEFNDSILLTFGSSYLREPQNFCQNVPCNQFT